MQKLGDLQFARAEGCGSLETFNLPGQRDVEAWRPSLAAKTDRAGQHCLPEGKKSGERKRQRFHSPRL